MDSKTKLIAVVSKTLRKNAGIKMRVLSINDKNNIDNIFEFNCYLNKNGVLPAHIRDIVNTACSIKDVLKVEIQLLSTDEHGDPISSDPIIIKLGE